MLLRSSTAETLKSFYLQVTLEPIQFTVADYYTMNLPFLAGIFTGVASYEREFRLRQLKEKRLNFNYVIFFDFIYFSTILYILKTNYSLSIFKYL